MNDSLKNLSPLDGRYQNKTKQTREIFSEHALIKERIRVEIQWLNYFLTHFKPELLTEQIKYKINALDKDVSDTIIERVKEIENVTNHDVKAVELAVAEQFEESEEIQSLFHIFLTSEDLNYHEVLEINNLSEHSKIFQENVKLVFENEEIVINSSLHLVDLILEKGKKGAQISRYKGLGEMNPNQLWETTLDPNSRSLVQVKIEQEINAEETFSTLMGEVVEPRRNFIQENALNVSNLDI